MLSAEIMRELREKHAQAARICSSIISMLYFNTTIIDYMHHVCFVYMLNSPVINSQSKRVSVPVNKQVMSLS